MKKSKWIPLLLTLIIWAGMYYYYLPVLNIHSNESWMFFVAMIVVALVINFWTIAKTLFFQKESQWESNPLLKKLLYIPLALVAIYGVGVLLSSPILRASAYSSLLTVQNGDFAEDIHEVNYSQIPFWTAILPQNWLNVKWVPWWTWFPSMKSAITTTRST